MEVSWRTAPIYDIYKYIYIYKINIYTKITFCHMSIPFLKFHNPTHLLHHPILPPRVILIHGTIHIHRASTGETHGSSTLRANVETRHVWSGKAKRGKRAKVTVSKPSTRQRSGSTLSQGIEPNSPAATALSWRQFFFFNWHRVVRLFGKKVSGPAIKKKGGCCKTLGKKTYRWRLMIQWYLVYKKK